MLTTLKEYLRTGREVLKREHNAGATGSKIVASYTLLIDNLLQKLFRTISDGVTGTDSIALVSTGGYGRRELNIGSDIDLMLLRSRRLTRATRELTERMLYLLWDTGLDISYSTMSLKESILLARDDLKTRTTLLDVRLLAGNNELVTNLERRLQRDIFNGKGRERFIQEKFEESSARQARYGGSVYILEPNVKESEGGLRDFQTLRWIAKVGAGIDTHVGLVENELFLSYELTKILQSVDFLWRVRNDLHFETGRKGDQLTFDQQERMAQAFGYKKGRGSLPVEELMGHYYRSGFIINHFSSRAITRLLSGESSGVRRGRIRKVIGGVFSVADGQISVVNEELFLKRPELMMKLFEYASLYSARIDVHTTDLLLNNRDRIDDAFRHSRAVAESFLNILNSKNAADTLQAMHELRILGRYIPEFQEVTYRTQHDLYHIYTVDAHSLFAVKEVEMLAMEQRELFPDLSTLYNETERHHILKLAILLHDIGKAHGKAHAANGALICLDICKRLGLSDEDTHLITFLVRHHLILANNAQYRDLHDEKFIIDFARSVGDKQRLDLLYLLTFADVRAVGPDIWTKWKGALFHELYTKAEVILERGSYAVEDTLEKLPALEAEVTERLQDVIASEVVHDFFELLPHRYFLTNEPDIIAEHISTVSELNERPFVIQIHQRTDLNYTEITLCTVDIHGLFSRVTGIMAAHNINIIGAQIFTMKNGLILDILQTNSSLGKMITDEGRLRSIEQDLEKVLTGHISIENLIKERAPSILAQKEQPTIHTSVAIDNEVSETFTVIDIKTADRVGLLYQVTRALSRLDLLISIAKVSTKGGEATDIFYVLDNSMRKIVAEEKLHKITKSLYETLVGVTAT
ncbi:MAG: [protein-PII] uridylyltransferase [Deltaproteobacteria bacterium]|nr:[protein-PII] uridylyltransferase [Deltaproteobacteria bacterium]